MSERGDNSKTTQKKISDNDQQKKANQTNNSSQKSAQKLYLTTGYPTKKGKTFNVDKFRKIISYEIYNKNVQSAIMI